MSRKKKTTEKSTNECCCKWCFHDKKDIGKLSTYDGRLYHEDCYYSVRDYNEIRDLWKANLTIEDNNDTYSKITTIYKGLLKKGYSSDYILFCVKYGISNKMLNYPLGLYYLVNNEKIKIAYEKKQFNEKARKLKQLQKAEMEEKIKEEKKVEFTFEPKKNNFFDIFGGK